ncbi:hypothetical protein FVE85_8244 [Porphyridium purpureum]|uniref:Uncharacterized protein n=1 Tax=Porphyridium purpureum TaxID=35688 RepID=A0A5J4YLA3_PORPP|nr:hypothetical protein FVE85_8244 [Porphyridium purpureum]|eukprot:POR8772..scf244_11
MEWMRVLAQGWMTPSRFPREPDMAQFVRTGRLGDKGLGTLCGVPPVLCLSDDDSRMDNRSLARDRALLLYAPQDHDKEIPLALLLAPSAYPDDRRKHLLQAFGNLDLPGVAYAQYVRDRQIAWLVGGEFVPLAHMCEDIETDPSAGHDIIQTREQLRNVLVQNEADSIAVLETNALLDDDSDFLLGSRIHMLRQNGFQAPLAVVLIPKAATSASAPHWRDRLRHAQQHQWSSISPVPHIVLLPGPARYALDFVSLLPDSPSNCIARAIKLKP